MKKDLRRTVAFGAALFALTLTTGAVMPSVNPTPKETRITVYKDLLDTKKVMVSSATRRLTAASAEARQEFRRTDGTTLAAERRRIERRLAFWRRQLRALKVKPA